MSSRVNVTFTAAIWIPYYHIKSDAIGCEKRSKAASSRRTPKRFAHYGSNSPYLFWATKVVVTNDTMQKNEVTAMHVARDGKPDSTWIPEYKMCRRAAMP